METVLITEEEFYGGGVETTTGSDTTLTKDSARLQVITLTGSANLVLPDATTMKEGGPHFYIRLLGAFVLTIKDDGGNTLTSFGSTFGVYIGLGDNSTANGVWAIKGINIIIPGSPGGSAGTAVVLTTVDKCSPLNSQLSDIFSLYPFNETSGTTSEDVISGFDILDTGGTPDRGDIAGPSRLDVGIEMDVISGTDRIAYTYDNALNKDVKTLACWVLFAEDSDFASEEDVKSILLVSTSSLFFHARNPTGPTVGVVEVRQVVGSAVITWNLDNALGVVQAGWHHMVLVWNGQYDLYFDGVLVPVTRTGVFPLFQISSAISSQRIELTDSWFESPQVKKSGFDQLLLSTEPLNALAINQLYNAGAGRPWHSGIKAQGTITIASIPSDGDTVTIDSKVYTYQTTLTDVDGNVHIGAGVAAARANLFAAINLSGVAGTDYATSMTLHPTVTAGTFTAAAGFVTAKSVGVAGNLIALAETFTLGNVNFWDGFTMGFTRKGVDALLRFT